MKKQTLAEYFDQHRTLLTLYGAYWGVDDQYDQLAETVRVGTDEDIRVAARRMQLEVPDIRNAKTSGYYILGKIGWSNV